jgi:hypothetical protein
MGLARGRIDHRRVPLRRDIAASPLSGGVSEIKLPSNMRLLSPAIGEINFVSGGTTQGVITSLRQHKSKRDTAKFPVAAGRHPASGLKITYATLQA